MSTQNHWPPQVHLVWDIRRLQFRDQRHRNPPGGLGPESGLGSGVSHPMMDVADVAVLVS